MEDSAASPPVRSGPGPCNALPAEKGIQEQLFGPEAGGTQCTFELLFCQRFQCAAADYQPQVFCRCLYRHARLLAPLLRMLQEDFFADDLRLLELVGEATNLREVSTEVRRYYQSKQARTDFWHKRCRLRVSGHAVLHLARELFQHS